MSTQLPIAYPDVDVPHALYLHHLDRMTAEGLHDKSAIAIQFAWRDERISELEQQLAEAQAKLQQQALEYLSLSGQQDEALRQLEEARKTLRSITDLRQRYLLRIAEVQAKDRISGGRTLLDGEASQLERELFDAIDKEGGNA
jgi:DNA-directed RNA polymerase subunit F